LLDRVIFLRSQPTISVHIEIGKGRSSRGAAHGCAQCGTLSHALRVHRIEFLRGHDAVTVEIEGPEGHGTPLRQGLLGKGQGRGENRSKGQANRRFSNHHLHRSSPRFD
jgi:hypothetical protein